jgi:hypothetical protein
MVSSICRISSGMSRVDSCTQVVAINSRGIPSGGFVYGLLHLIAN